MDSAGTILLFCLICLPWRPLEGRYYTNVFLISRNIQYTPLMDRGFGFLTDGEIQFTMSCLENKKEVEKPDFWLLFCTSSKSREFTRLQSRQLEDQCQGLQQAEGSFCTSHHVYENTSVQHHGRHQFSLDKTAESPFYTLVKYSLDKKMDSAFYTVILLQCSLVKYHTDDNLTRLSPTHRSCESELLTLNPGNVHLGSDEIPLPVIYTIINLFWATLVGAWFFNWVIYFKFSNRLHQLISCAPIFKVILVVLILLWWQEIASSGVEPKDILSIRVFVESIEDSLLFITMMVIAEGWGVVRCQLKHYRWTSLILLFLLFATSLMCVHWVHRYFLAFSVCCVVYIMYKTLKWTSHNIDLLRRRRRKIHRFVSRHNLRYRGIITLETQLVQKLQIYQKFRVMCATFSMVYAIARTLGTFLNEFTDIKALTLEIPKLLVYTSIGIIFRLRNFEPYENIELVPPKENVVVIELPDVCFGQVDPHVTLGIPLHFKVEKETQTPRRRWRAPII